MKAIKEQDPSCKWSGRKSMDSRVKLDSHSVTRFDSSGQLFNVPHLIFPICSISVSGRTFDVAVNLFITLTVR